MVQLKFGLKRKSCLTVTSLILLCVIAIWLFHSYSSSFWNQLSPFAVGESDPVVIVILGGGVTAEGRVPEHTQERVKVALCVYHQEVMGNGLFITLSGGTPHKPNPLDEKGFPVWEATAAARALLEAGVPPERILEESFSLDTVGNVRSILRSLAFHY